MSKTATIPEDIRKLSFEESLAELENIIRSLEAGSLTLKNALESYERGMLLRKQCEAHLKQAETKLTELQPMNETSGEA